MRQATCSEPRICHRDTASGAAGAPRGSAAIFALLARISAPRGCCVTFHRVAPGARWKNLLDRGFTVELEAIDRLLALLIRGGWDIVTVSEILHRGGCTSPFVNFSIDDAYRDTFELLVPLFRKHGVPLTIYVTTGIPDGGYTLWRGGLETILLESGEVLMTRDRTRIAVPGLQAKRDLFWRLCREWDATDAAVEYHAFCRANGYDPAVLHKRQAISWEMLRRLAGDDHVEIGAHTLTHPRLSALAADDAVREMAGSRDRLEARLQRPIKHFAFPFGRRDDCGPREFALARRAGFSSAATTRKGLIHPDRISDPFALPRNTINGVHAGGAAMAMHLTGLGGVIAHLLGRH